MKTVTIISLAALPATWGNWGVLRAEPIESAEYLETETGTLNEMFDKLNALLDAFPQEFYDLDKLAHLLPNHPEEIAAFVAEASDWEPYEGLFKGAKGTLISGGGNSLDRSVLLLHLLRLKGFSARIAYAEHLQPSDQANLAKLLESHRLRQTHQPSLINEKTVLQSLLEDEAVDRTSFETFANELESANLFYATTQQITYEHSEFLLSQLEKHGNLSAGEPIRELEPFDQGHFWVQYQNQEEWHDICVVYGNAIPDSITSGRNVATFNKSDEMPDHWIHKISIRVILEQKHQRDVIQRTVMNFNSPVHRIANQQVDLLFTHVGGEGESVLTREGNPDDQLREYFETPSGWTPVLKFESGAADYFENAFDRTGQVFDPNTPPAAEKFRKAKNLLGSVSFGKQENTPSQEVLKSLRYEIEIQAPGLSPRIETRFLFTNHDLVPTKDHKAAISKQLSFAASRWTQILVQTGRLDMSYVAMKQLQAANELTLSSKYLIRSQQKEGPDGSIETESLLKALKRTPQFNALIHHFAAHRSVNLLQSRAHMSSANVISYFKEIQDDGEQLVQYKGFDILANQIEFSPSIDRRTEASIRFGVFDTTLERRILEHANQGLFGEQFGASSMTDLKMDSGNWAYVSNLGELESYADTFSKDLFQVLQTQLDRGFELLFPSPNDPGHLSFWRFDPKSGETLGMTYSKVGLGGSEMMKYVLLVSGILGVIMAIWTLHDCLSGNTPTFACVLCALFAGALIFLAVALGLSALRFGKWASFYNLKGVPNLVAYFSKVAAGRRLTAAVLGIIGQLSNMLCKAIAQATK